MLEVRLLGTFEVRHKKKPVSISSRPAQTLFAFLILNAGTAHRREKLAGLLWPDSLEETARENLRHALWRLRKALPSPPKVEYLLADDLSIAFNVSAEYWLDTVQLENLSESDSADELMAALSEYHGELMPGFYDEWVVLEREHIYSIFEHHMARLMSLLEGERRWLDILDWAERWIKLGQKPEPAYRALMSAHAAKGDMSKVAATYERCAKSLHELGFEPSEQTRALYEKLKAGKENLEMGSAIAVEEKRTESPKTNLPVPLTSFIGRKKELKEIAELLSSSRLLTLTGSGGVGKTRLAIQTASDSMKKSKEGAFWVGLVGLPDANSIPQEIARSLRVREVPEVPLIETLKNDLADKDLLLILDNCEHLIEAVAQTAEQLLGACPNIKILATSRERLGIFNETVWHVPSLSENTSRELFVERARAVQHGFVKTNLNESVIAQICERLDRIPLAIELAAARVPVLSVEEIAKRLDDRFSLLTSGSRTAMARQQTLRAAIDWSYDLLTEPEQILFQRLAVFTGGFTLEAAGEVCGFDHLKRKNILDLLGRLVDKSLVIVDSAYKSGETRYSLLETMREYAREKLIESGEEHITRDHHMEFFCQLAIKAEAKLSGAETLLWINRLEAEHDNLLATIDWSLKSENTDFAIEIVGALLQWDAWHNNEGAERSLQVVRSPLANRGTLLHAKALSTAGVMQWFQGNFVQARILLEEAVSIGKKSATKEGYYVWALATLGAIAATEGDYATAQASLEEGLAEAHKLGVSGLEAMGFSLAYLGDVFILQGDRERARQMYEESTARLRELNNKNFLAYPLRRLAELALDRMDYKTALALCQESLTLNIEGRDQRAIAACLAGFAAIAAVRGHALPAIRLYAAVESFLETISATLLMTDRKHYDRNVAMLHSQFDEATFNAAWSTGRAMTLEQAIEFALKETQI